MSADPLTILGKPLNLMILSHLKSEARNPRELAKILNKHETHISSKLRLMEGMGLVKGGWVRKGNKNIKLYKLRTESLQLSLTPEGYEIRFGPSGEPVTIPLLHEAAIPQHASFVGRKKELSLLRSASNFIVVEGIPGIGKTWLAARFVSQLPFKQIFWHSIKGFDTFDSVMRKLAVFTRAQGKTELYDYVRSNGPDKSVKLELLAKEVDDWHNALVFDDYHACNDKDIEELVAHLRNNLQRARIIIVSRTRPRFATEGGITELLLPGFTLEDTAAFLSRRGITRSSALASLVQEKLRGHPLSLEFLSEASRDGDVRVAVESVKEAKLLHYLWTHVYDSLSEVERDVLRSMSAFRTSASIDALRFVCGPKAHLAIHELERRHLVTEVAQRYWLHDLVKEMSYRLPESPHATHRKIADYYLKAGTLAGRVEAVYHLLEAREYEKIAKMVEEQFLNDLSITVTDYAVPYANLLKGLPIDSVSKERRPYVLAMIGGVEAEYVDLDRGLETLSKAPKMAEEQGDFSSAARMMIMLGRAYLHKREMKKAEGYLLKAAGYLEKEQGPVMLRLALCETYSYLLELCGMNGSMDRALKYAQRSLKVARQISSPRQEHFHCLGIAHHDLAWLYQMMGRFAKAKVHFRQALRMFHQSNEANNIAIAQLALASVSEEEGKVRSALALCEKSIELYKSPSLGVLLVPAKAMRAKLLLKSGRELDAADELSEVSRLSRGLKGRAVLGDVEFSLGMFHSRAGRWDEATKHYRRAIDILRRDVYPLGIVYQEYAMMWLERRDHERFKICAEKAIELFRKVRAEHRVRQLRRVLAVAEVSGPVIRPPIAPMQLKTR